MPPVSGASMLRHLIEARQTTQTSVAQGTGLSLSTVSEVLSGKRKLNTEEPQPPVTPAPRAPSWLSKEAKKEWRRLAPVLGAIGVLTTTDADALAGYCEAWATWKDATQKIREFGMER